MLFRSLKDNLPNLRPLSDTALEKKIGKSKTEESAEQLFSFLDGGVKKPLTYQEAYAVSMQSFRCLKNYLEKVVGIPLTLNNVLNNMHLLQYAVDLDFPYYYESKLLSNVVGFKQAA